jgi:mannose-6-phosphate isomerase-like protein (cupin superfamily)
VSGGGVRRHAGDQRWDGVEVLAYKAAGEAPFKDVTRQVLFDDDRIGAQLRYFEVSPGGWTTLERHEHVHNVLVLRGRGRCLVGDAVRDLALHDLVEVPPWTWHQFRAAPDEPLGFLCLVRQERDRPQLPGAGTAAALLALFDAATAPPASRDTGPG